MKMALNVLSAPALWTGYTLILMIIVDGTKGASIPEILVAGTDGGIIGTLIKLLEIIDTRFKTIEETVIKTTNTVDIIANKITETLEKVEPIAAIEKIVNETSINVVDIGNTVDAVNEKVISIDAIVDWCPVSDGFFIAPGTGGNQCLKMFSGSSNFDNAVTKCNTERAKERYTVELARPYNALALRQFLFEEYSIPGNFWVNARGNGDQINWETKRLGGESQHINPNGPLWRADQPGTSVGTSFCMVLAAEPIEIKNQLTKAYFMQSCTDNNYVICELSPKITSISFTNVVASEM